MADELVDDKKEAKGPDLEKARVPEQLPASEREVFEGKILELKEENESLKGRIAQLEKPKSETKKKSVMARFSPL